MWVCLFSPSALCVLGDQIQVLGFHSKTPYLLSNPSDHELLRNPREKSTPSFCLTFNFKFWKALSLMYWCRLWQLAGMERGASTAFLGKGVDGTSSWTSEGLQRALLEGFYWWVFSVCLSYQGEGFSLNFAFEELIWKSKRAIDVWETRGPCCADCRRSKSPFSSGIIQGSLSLLHCHKAMLPPAILRLYKICQPSS